VLALSLDGRLAPPEGGAAQIGGRGDRRVLEEALAWADAALLGAETLRRHGSTCLIHAPDLLAQRRQQGRSDQPVALVASRSGHIPAGLPFFAQPLERWLLQGRAPGQSAATALDQGLPTAAAGVDSAVSPARVAAVGASAGAGLASPAGHVAELASAGRVAHTDAPAAGFARVIGLDGWQPVLRQLAAVGLARIAVLGGAGLAASLLAENRIEELQLTLCPQLLGGANSWLGPGAVVPLDGRAGWRLLELRCLEGQELLLRYGREPFSR